MKRFNFLCPKCSESVLVSEEERARWPGDSFRCPQCGAATRIPAESPTYDWLSPDQQLTLFWIGISLPIVVAGAFFAHELGVYQAVLNVLTDSISGVRISLPEIDKRLLLLVPYRVFVTGWTLNDVRDRDRRTFPVWQIASVLLPTATLAFWLGIRPLTDGETRRGGTAWNILRGFALAWSALWLSHGIAFGAYLALVFYMSNPEMPLVVGFEIYWLLRQVATAWIAPLVAALVLGQFVRDDQIVERG